MAAAAHSKRHDLFIAIEMEPVPAPDYVPRGHFYSPIPAKEDIERALSEQPGGAAILGTELHETEQLALLNRLARYYPEISFPENKNDHYRYAFNCLAQMRRDILRDTTYRCASCGFDSSTFIARINSGAGIDEEKRNRAPRLIASGALANFSPENLVLPKQS